LIIRPEIETMHDWAGCSRQLQCRAELTARPVPENQIAARDSP
jgi:hypothetical protein